MGVNKGAKAQMAAYELTKSKKDERGGRRVERKQSCLMPVSPSGIICFFSILF